jgi:uncharacterized protein (TIGR02186 family)
MKAIVVVMLGLLLGCTLAAPAAASLTCPRMDLELSKKLVEMGMTYDGDTIAVSGTAPQGSQVAVVLVSEHNPPLRLTRKGRVVLFWMAVKQLEACNVPYLYKLYSSAPVTQIASPEVVRELNLGYGNLRSLLVTRCLKGEPADDDASVLFDGFIKLKEDSGLYGVEESALSVGPDGRFEQAVAFPDKAPEGKYLIHAYAFKDGRLVASATREVSAEKIGLGAWLTETARDNGLFYGLMAVVVALSAGLGVGTIFKKGGAH